MTVMMTKLLLIDGSELTSDVDDDDVNDVVVGGVVVVGCSDLTIEVDDDNKWCC